MALEEVMRNHTDSVSEDLWTYSGRFYNDELDDGRRQERPPVFAPRHAFNNLLVHRIGQRRTPFVPTDHLRGIWVSSRTGSGPNPDGRHRSSQLMWISTYRASLWASPFCALSA